MKNLMGRAALMVALAMPFATSTAQATGAAAAAAVGSGHKANTPPTVGAGIVGATGYVFVNGVGWEGASMVYCPPKIGYVKPTGLLLKSTHEVKDGICYKHGSHVTAPVVTAQQYIDTLLGEGVAEVVSVAPVLGSWRVFGVIYYRAVAP